MLTSATHTTGQHETVESLIRYAVERFNRRGIRFPAARMSKLIRRQWRSNGPTAARRAVDAYMAEDRSYVDSWAGFEEFVNGYADPTGELATRNLDRADAATLIRARREGVTHD